MIWAVRFSHAHAPPLPCMITQRLHTHCLLSQTNGNTAHSLNPIELHHRHLFPAIDYCIINQWLHIISIYLPA
jgi:hypothetical protein